MSPAVRHGKDAPRQRLADGLATAWLAGPWTEEAIVAGATAALGRKRTPKWVAELVRQVLDAHPRPPVDRPREFAAFVRALPALASAWKSSRPPHVVVWEPAPTSMGRVRWPVPDLPDVAALARFLGLDDVDQGELAWFADVRGLERVSARPLRHYRWWLEPKRTGVRVVAAPKARLKAIQRLLLRELFGPIPVHDAAHGCVPGRSVRTAALPHAGQPFVVQLDLESYFASIRAGRVWGVLRNAGYPEAVAHTITGLVTTTAPVSVVRAIPSGRDPDATFRLRQHLRAPHLPAGAPTSPVIANLVTHSLDRRLAGLALRFGVNYTRYVDDLTFSGSRSLGRRSNAFLDVVDEIVREEGFRLNALKTRVATSSRRQSMLGVVVNERPTLPRPDRDALRALLHNCAVHGWRSQARGRTEFRAYLEGRVAWAAGVDPVFGERLHAMSATIDWT